MSFDRWGRTCYLAMLIDALKKSGHLSNQQTKTKDQGADQQALCDVATAMVMHCECGQTGSRGNAKGEEGSPRNACEVVPCRYDIRRDDCRSQRERW